MENASKALIMAGGILLALMVVGALMLMFNQIGAYQESTSASEKASQLAQFNQEFTKYSDEGQLKGIDIISLANKIVDFNQKEGTGNYVDYEKDITLKINLTGFADDYGVSGVSKLFGNTTVYQIQNDSNAFMNAIITFSALEKKYTLATMAKLKSNYTTIKSGEKTIKDVTGKQEMQDNISLDDIAKYIEYTELKSSTFELVGEPQYDAGQITQLEFRYVD